MTKTSGLPIMAIMKHETGLPTPPALFSAVSGRLEHNTPYPLSNMTPIRIRDLMSRDFEPVRPEDSLQQVVKIMRRTKIDDLPVLDDSGLLKGVVTKASLFDAIAAGKPLDTPARNLLKTNVTTVSEEADYSGIIERVRSASTGSAIVVDTRKHVVGVLTKAAWIAAMLDREAILNTQLQAIMQTMHNGLITMDAGHCVTSINRAAVAILNLDPDSAVGNPIGHCMPGLELDRVLIIGTSRIGVEYWRDDLSLICNVSPIISDNGITGAVIVFQDLTELIKTISQLEGVTKLYGTLKSVMDIAYDGMVVVDEKRRITMINQPAARFFRKQEDQMLGQPVGDILSHDRIEAVIATGRPEINRLQLIEGTPYVVSILPIMRKGNVIGAVIKILFQHLQEVKDLAEKLENADQQLAYYRDRSEAESEKTTGFDQIVTADPVFVKIKEEGQIVARGSSNILITGESGTGKELIAQAIHAGSTQANGPLVKINCAAIPENLLESEFFGYAPGAFSGASKHGRTGKLLSAEGGTLFLDEIGDMPLSLQGKLLRVLQDKRFEPVGSNKTIEVNTRIITATNQDLEKQVTQGRFRADLYYRLNVINFHLPPLRERRSDINLLVHLFLEKYRKVFGRRVSGVTDDALVLLQSHNWSGNVRELENVIERAINFASGVVIGVEDLPPYLREKSTGMTAPRRPVPPEKRLRKSREKTERQEIMAALEQAGGNRAKAARLLGISRSWLYEKMKQMNG
ncbi:sigma 54-interacting transcriptional regulator [bacterium]|nr:sigma 54-interacting transcriptional regulator [bacterium]